MTQIIIIGGKNLSITDDTYYKMKVMKDLINAVGKLQRSLEK